MARALVSARVVRARIRALAVCRARSQETEKRREEEDGEVVVMGSIELGTQRCRVADTGTAPSRDQSSLRWKPNGGLEVRDARGVGGECTAGVQTGVIGRLPLWMMGKHLGQFDLKDCNEILVEIDKTIYKDNGHSEAWKVAGHDDGTGRSKSLSTENTFQLFSCAQHSYQDFQRSENRAFRRVLSQEEMAFKTSYRLSYIGAIILRTRMQLRIQDVTHCAIGIKILYIILGTLNFDRKYANIWQEAIVDINDLDLKIIAAESDYNSWFCSEIIGALTRDDVSGGRLTSRNWKSSMLMGTRVKDKAAIEASPTGS
ncbi:hypothetical protein EAG_15248 [Camponotus floridanus]|uniref:Uncharacterized protein n=1 Tax=Camponotus floridanus TaxID=104421 RepID=E2A090_CAMFO|nr:hypothetical protein EAG_15248 [Camponotus floridanus]